jgi:single-strand DNA-binding protein
MNKIILLGRLTRDPEIRYAQSTGNAVARFSLAVDRRFKRDGDPSADFFDCIAFGKTAEFAEKYLRKGTKIVLSGQLQNNNYTNKDGQKVYGMQILVDELEFAESKNSSNANNNSTPEPERQRTDTSSFMTIPDSEVGNLPFD